MQNMADRISEQTILEKAYIPETKTIATTTYGFDGVNAQATPATAMATKITTVGDVTYIGKAKTGTAQATAKWRCQKIDSGTPGTVVITWADGDAEFNNVATDLTALNYS